MDNKTKKVIFIVGPTAIGKTDLSINVAKKINTEIISCDSRQIYKELKIGTSPPSSENLNTITHHFVHKISIKENYNAGKFEKEAIKLISELHIKKNKILIVGGSGLYIDAITKGFDSIPQTSIYTRKKLNEKYIMNGMNWLQKEVEKCDPVFYHNCDQKNPQRLLRALEIYNETGKKISALQLNTIKKRNFQSIKIGIYMERELLYDRINQRVDLMIKKGLVEEVKSLLEYKNYNALQTVGYKEIFDFLENKYTLEKAISEIKKNTRRFAKRQISWFKRDKEINWFNINNIKAINAFIEEL